MKRILAPDTYERTLRFAVILRQAWEKSAKRPPILVAGARTAHKETDWTLDAKDGDEGRFTTTSSAAYPCLGRDRALCHPSLSWVPCSCCSLFSRCQNCSWNRRSACGSSCLSSCSRCSGSHPTGCPCAGRFPNETQNCCGSS